MLEFILSEFVSISNQLLSLHHKPVETIKYYLYFLLMLNFSLSHRQSDIKHSFAVGATSGFISSFLTAPAEAVNKALHLAPSLPERPILIKPATYSGVIDCSRKLTSQHGFNYLFKSEGYFSPRLVLTVSLVFSLKEFFRSKQQRIGGKTSMEKVKINFLSGGLAGALSEAISLPLKNLEILYQQKSKVNTVKIEDFSHLIQKTHKQRGFQIFYKGFAVSCLHQTFYRSLYFGIYDSLRIFLQPEKSYNFLVCYPTGYIASFISSTLSFPISKIMTRMSQKSQSWMDSFQRLSSSEGLLRGWKINFLGSFRGAFVLALNDGISFYSRRKHLFY